MAFVVSSGSVQALSRPAVTYQQRIMVSPFLAMDYNQIWRSQPSVRRAVTFLARNIAQLGLHCFERVGDTDRRRLTDHPLAQLLAQPSSYTTLYRFLNTLVHEFAVYDAAYFVKDLEHGTKALEWLPAPLVTPGGENWLTPDFFEYRGMQGAKLFPREQILYFRGYGGFGDMGCSPLEALRRTLLEDFAAGEMREQVLRNGARASGYLQRPLDAGKWSNEARQKFKQQWQSQYAGDLARQGGGTPVLEDGMSFNPVSQTAEELQYIEARKLTDEEVGRSYFIPPPMIGILEHATFSNIEEQHKMLYQDCLGPWLKMIEDEIDLQLVPDFEPVHPESYYCEFNLMEKLTGNIENRDAAITASVGAPWRTINEGRTLANLPPVDGGDELIMPLNVTQNGDQEPIPAAPAAQEPAEEPKLYQRRNGVLLGRP